MAASTMATQHSKPRSILKAKQKAIPDDETVITHSSNSSRGVKISFQAGTKPGRAIHEARASANRTTDDLINEFDSLMDKYEDPYRRNSRSGR